MCQAWCQEPLNSNAPDFALMELRIQAGVGERQAESVDVLDRVLLAPGNITMHSKWFMKYMLYTTAYKKSGGKQN